MWSRVQHRSCKARVFLRHSSALWVFCHTIPPCHEAFAVLSTCWGKNDVNKAKQKRKKREKWQLWLLRWAAVWFFFWRRVLEGLPQDVSCAALWWVESVWLQLDVSSTGNRIAAKRESTHFHTSWVFCWKSTHPHKCYREAETKLLPSSAIAAGRTINLAATNLSGVVSPVWFNVGPRDLLALCMYQLRQKVYLVWKKMNRVKGRRRANDLPQILPSAWHLWENQEFAQDVLVPELGGYSS